MQDDSLDLNPRSNKQTNETSNISQNITVIAQIDAKNAIVGELGV